MAQTGIITRKVKVKLNYLEEKPEVYKLQQINLPKINCDTLVKEISNACGVNASSTESVITALLDRLVHYMEIGHAVQLRKFGTFKPTFTSKVATKLENLSADNVLVKKVRFYPGKSFQSMLSDMSVGVGE